MLYNDIEKILITKEEISKKVNDLGNILTNDYKNKNALFICLLKGASVFFCDLIRAVNLPLEIDFMIATSYGKNTISSGELKIEKDLAIDIKNKHILIVEDIVDSGNTYYNLKKHLLGKGAKDVKICSLLDKPSRRAVDIVVDYIGFQIEDEFVVGYGMDYSEHYRNLNEVCVLKKKIYEK